MLKQNKYRPTNIIIVRDSLLQKVVSRMYFLEAKQEYESHQRQRRTISVTLRTRFIISKTLCERVI